MAKPFALFSFWRRAIWQTRGEGTVRGISSEWRNICCFLVFAGLLLIVNDVLSFALLLWSIVVFSMPWRGRNPFPERGGWVC